MFNYLIKKQNRNADIFTAAMFVMSLVFLASSAVGLRPKSLCQFFCVLFLSLGILIANRYILSGFCYIINLEQLPGTLSVLQKQGKRQYTVCRVDLDKICGFYIVNPGEKLKLAEKHGKITKCCNYCATLFPSRYLLIVYDDMGSKSTIKLEADESFKDKISQLLGQIQV